MRARPPGRRSAVVLGLAIASAAAVFLVLGNTVAPVPTPGPSVAAQVATPTGGVWRAVSIAETFDGLPMDSSLPAPWQVSGAGSARVTALPTSVDRSVRIASDGTGAPSLACRATDVAASESLAVALDFRLGRQPVQSVTLVELRSGGSAVVRVVLDPTDGRIAAMPGSANPPGGTAAPESPRASIAATIAPDAWRRLELTVTEGGIVSWRSREGSGSDAGSGTFQLAPDLATVPDTLCVQSPSGSPSGWIAVDDLLIEG